MSHTWSNFWQKTRKVEKALLEQMSTENQISKTNWICLLYKFTFSGGEIIDKILTERYVGPKLLKLFC